MFFHTVPMGPPDAIFGLAGTMAADLRKNKVDLLVGIYKNEKLESELMPSVAIAKQHILAEDSLADYLPIDGDPAFIQAVGALAFGQRMWQEQHSRIYGAQTPGGTAALRVGAEFIAQEVTKTIYIPQPTWPNHRAIFERAGMRVETYPYHSSAKRGFDSDALFSALTTLPKKSAVLFHAACHNPTGSDPTVEQWSEIARIVGRHELLPFFDFAYQGLGEGIEADAKALHIFDKEGLEYLVAYSCSKNFSLYCQRVGALFVVDENAAVKSRVASQIKRIIRTLYSNPPAHGARIVAHLLTGNHRESWERDLTRIRERLQTMRKELVYLLSKTSKKTDFSSLLEHKGMFSFIDLNKHQVQRLIDETAIYMPDNGRLNVAGLNRDNLDYVVQSIARVVEL